MTNEQKLREIAEKWGIRAAFHEECGQYEYLLRPNECLSDLTALISEHYIAKEDVDKMVSERCKKCKYRGLPDNIQEALNSGDGVYRP